ncbi:hypothetical protein FFONT_0372 [Fervidicoccus fontis Kam940]|uniref:Uncharacterized protein n=1 Tax=Fervidicoccus fontis (strain DSM 19380 / JCM 18336 / VKM B-2539 / Kam940) TaxID=1163730 RepID=I0A055_FERFK|nr:hypothetical protein FFONT_0372 [Fervidicoccus fontis Kam940]
MPIHARTEALGFLGTHNINRYKKNFLYFMRKISEKIL